MQSETWPDDAVEIGRVIGAWGIKGGIRVKPFAASPQALFSSKRWFLRWSERPGDIAKARVAAANLPTLLRITQAREQGDSVVALVQDIADRNSAQALAGAAIFVSRASFPTPDENEFYWVDLIGLKVLNREGDDLGSVESLLETGPHCVLSLSSLTAEGQARMIPFVDAYVDNVDLAEKRISVNWPADF